MNKAIIDLLKRIIELVGFISENLSQHSQEEIKNLKDFTEKKEEINRLYLSLTKRELKDFYNMLNDELAEDSLMHVYLLSILLNNLHKDEILERIVEIILRSPMNIFQSVFLELQMACEIFSNNAYGDMYQLKRKLHSYNVKKYCESVGVTRNYIPYKDRKMNRIVVITEQVLALNHAPTKVILEQCYTLEKNLGIEVFLISAPIKGISNYEMLWFYAISENRLTYLDGNNIVTYKDNEIFYSKADLNNEFYIVYKDVPIRGRQIAFEENNEDSLKQLVQQIYEFNPVFVYDMGSLHPLAGACSSFTTVAAMSMSYGYPVSDAPILLSFNRQSEHEEEISEITLSEGSSQVVLRHPFIFTIDKPVNPHSRAEYGLPEDIFLIALVSNRLKAELTEELIQLLRQIMAEDDKIDILLIGMYPDYETTFHDTVFKDRVHYLGYQEDYADVIAISDIYLNPPRTGGGTSALLALYAGVPVVTLPQGDVASNVCADFVCRDYGEITETIMRYKQDKEFYSRQRAAGIEYTHRITDMAGNLKNIVSRIKDTILTLEGRTADEY